MSLKEARESGLVAEINRVLLHPAGFRLVVTQVNDEMREAADEQGWPEPKPELIILDEKDQKGGVVFRDDTIAEHLDTFTSGADYLAKRTMDRAPARNERYDFDRQPLPGHTEK